MPEKPFLVLVVTVAFIALGVMGLLLSLTLWTTPLTEEMQLAVMVSTVISFGYLVIGYGLYRGYKWGWFLAFGLTVLNIISNIYFGSYQVLMVDALLLVLLLLTMKYYGIPFGKPTQPQSSPVPPPSMPIAAAFAIPKEGKRFVKRKHRY
ncbi:MAG: hypothetical protein DRJ18_00980 [Candidatus Methanomethylicota archaeon]|nr:MAG: hypothetical protein DRJ18_00980 [Candidatus Verstraetearchaeota archaeon]